jgi:signal transduction histidine kinase
LGTHSQSVSSSLAGSYTAILEALCGAPEFRDAVRSFLKEVSAATGCEAVGLRVHDRKDDYPYFSYLGFDDSFIEKESCLCRCEDDCGELRREQSGVSMLECMCGRVLRGHTDPELPFFTAGGSFLTNAGSELVKSGALQEEDVRGTCVAAGYESIALVPLRVDERIVGLLQCNSNQKDRFSEEVIDFLERITGHAARAVEAAWKREELTLLLKGFEAQQRGPDAVLAFEEMASTLAHEIKNPLAGMALSAGRLKKAVRGQEKAEEIAEHLTSSINTLSETVTRVTRSAGGSQVQREPLDVNEVLEMALALVTPWATEGGTVIVRRMSDALPAVIGDAHHLRSAFLNLLLNALEVMPDGGRLTVITRKADEDHLEVIIADEGPGVDPERVDSLFKPFVTGKEHGSGLGLAIVRRIAEVHGGSATLRPGAEGGAEAVLRLPCDEGAVPA